MSVLPFKYQISRFFTQKYMNSSLLFWTVGVIEIEFLNVCYIKLFLKKILNIWIFTPKMIFAYFPSELALVSGYQTVLTFCDFCVYHCPPFFVSVLYPKSLHRCYVPFTSLRLISAKFNFV